MHVVRILYPRTSDSFFNLRHYLDVHTPLGLGLLRSVHGVVPLRVEVDHEPRAAGPGPAPWHCASHLYFARREEVEAFQALFADPDCARLLAQDFAHYTTHHPVIHVSEVISIDPVTHAPV